MAELKAQVEQAANAVEKTISEQAARFETLAAEVVKLQNKGIAQASVFLEDATRIARDQLAFAEQIGSEWRKLMLASTKSASQLFTPKA